MGEVDINPEPPSEIEPSVRYMGNCLTSSASITPLSDSSSAMSAASPPAPPPKRRRLSAPPPVLPPLLASDLDLRLLYDLGPELGRGQFGIIRLCTHRSSLLPFACKSIPKLSFSSSPRHFLDVVREIQIMQILPDHPHLVRLHHVFEDKAFVHLVMELCSGGELFDRILRNGSFPEPQAAPIIKSLIETVRLCHSVGVMHRDLKPENILLADSSESSAIKLADFGLALRFSPGQKFSGMAGSAYYIAPEVLQGRYSEEIDIWSAGVILYILLSGVPPFWGETEQEIFEAIKEGKVDFPDDPWCKVSHSAKDLIRGMLCSDATARLTPAQILEHPWILHHAPTKQQRQGQHALASQRSFTDETRPEAPSMSAASRLDFSQYQSAVQSALSDVSDAPSFHVPTHQGFDVAPATPPPAHTRFPLPSISSISSFPTGLQSHDKGGFGTQSSINRAPVIEPSPESHEPDGSSVTELDFNDLLREIITELTSSPLSSSDILARVTLPEGCTCTLLDSSAKEQTFLIQMKQGKFLVVNDKLRKQIGWKQLELQEFRPGDSKILPYCTAPTNGPLFHQSQTVF